jgi:hypothetical protein
MHQLQKCDGSKNVVAGCDDSSCSEAPLEPYRQIDERYQEREEDRDDRPPPELASNLAGNRFRADHSNTVGAEPLLKNLLDAVGDIGGTFRLRCDFARILRAHCELAVGSELLDLRAWNVGRVQGRANHSHIWRLCKLQLHQGATRELNAVVGRFDRERAEAGQNKDDRDDRHDLPPADEIVVGVVKNSKHQMLREAWASRVRLSQIM